jgi:hypothetical protein
MPCRLSLLSSLLAARPKAEQKPLRAALDVAAVSRWFDEGLLRRILDIPDDEARSKAAAVLRVNHGTTGEDGNSVCCGYGDRQFCPVHPIGAYGMPPGDGIGPRCPERIILEKQMVLALIVDEPIWIIHPVLCRREVEPW